MPKLFIKSTNSTIDVPGGTLLIDAMRKAGVSIDAPCGGRGTCGKCLVHVTAGNVHTESLGILPQDIIDEGFVLACKTTILDEPITVTVPGQVGRHGGKFFETDGYAALVPAELMPKDWQFEPLVSKFCLEVPPPQLEDGLSDFDRLSRRIQKEWGKKEVRCPVDVLRKLAGAVRDNNGTVTITLSRNPHVYDIVDIAAGDSVSRQFGIAVDVGTTTVAVQLVDMTENRIVSAKVAYNDQIACGLDVISRITYAQKPERLEELRTRVVDTINRLIGQAVADASVDPSDIINAAISGNTTMTHLLLGLKPEHIRLEPYTPTINEALPIAAKDIGISINPETPVSISPGVGSYVGGDITAGILCTELSIDRELPSLFIDIGTNGELAVGNKDFLMTCACSAGPAFEGGGIACGMHASSGAIDKAAIDLATGIPAYSTINNEPVRGICGSGMIALISSLFLTGWIDAAGKIVTSKPCAAIKTDGRKTRYVLAPPEKSGTGKEIYITQTDIDNIIRAKAAIYAACDLLLKKAGLSFNDLETIYIAGGFGRSLDLEKAIVMGLLPDLSREKFKYIGNSSLMGSFMILISQEFRRKQTEIAKRMTYIELNTDPTYMDAYTGALFLPHTNSNLFPSVKRI